MIIITGAAGFIGSNLLNQLKNKNYIKKNDYLLVDNKKASKKFKNLSQEDYDSIIDFSDEAYLTELLTGKKITVFHLGACSDTTERNIEFLRKNNFENSKFWFNLNVSSNSTLIYASSASVYGKGIEQNRAFFESQVTSPLNPYAQSKNNFDNFVNNNNSDFDTVLGLRYFNVFGPGENHKEKMCSPILHFFKQALKEQKIKIFSGYDNFSNKDFKRDFIHVEDAVNLTIDAANNKNLFKKKLVLNIGTGSCLSFNSIAEIVAKKVGKLLGKSIEISEIEFPQSLKKGYQQFTLASLDECKKYDLIVDFLNHEKAINSYLDYLYQNKEMFND